MKPGGIQTVSFLLCVLVCWLCAVSMAAQEPSGDLAVPARVQTGIALAESALGVAFSGTEDSRVINMVDDGGFDVARAASVPGAILHTSNGAARLGDSYFLAGASHGSIGSTFGYDQYNDIQTAIDHRPGDGFYVWADELLVADSNETVPVFHRDAASRKIYWVPPPVSG